MPSLLVPNSWGSLREDNYCHLPDGRLAPKGQGVCSKGPQFSDDYPPALAEQMARNYTELMSTSFHSDKVREIAVAYGENGAIHTWKTGDEDSVDVGPEAKDVWAKAGGVTFVHTHPLSGPFSFQDLIMANTANLRTSHRGKVSGSGRDLKVAFPPTAVRRMVVYAQDGSWYEMKLHRVFTPHEMADLEMEYYSQRDTHLTGLAPTLDRAVCEALHYTYIDSSPTDSVVTFSTRPETKSYLRRDALGAEFYRRTGRNPDKFLAPYWRDHLANIWETLATRHPEMLTFRAHLAPQVLP